jgi:hypothetical protein
MNSTAVIQFFADNPRSTVKEAGITNAEANILVGQGKLIAVGKRSTGKKGKPPTEYVVMGTELSDDAYVQAAVESARDRIRAHRSYERMSNAIMRAANQHGHGSPEHLEAKLTRTEAFTVLPVLPSSNDYVLAGEAVDLDEPLPVLEVA